MLSANTFYSINLAHPNLELDFQDDTIQITALGKMYSIKAKNENDMIEWVSILRSKQQFFQYLFFKFE